MCIGSNWVNQAQDLMAVKNFDDLLNSLIPSEYSTVQQSTVPYYTTQYSTVQ